MRVLRIPKYVVNLQTVSVSHAVQTDAVKREPGENPGQTRCCNSPEYLVQQVTGLKFQAVHPKKLIHSKISHDVD